jgi:hypothetical protein
LVLSIGSTPAADLAEVLPPVAVLVAALVVIVVTIVTARRAERPRDPAAVLRSSGPVGRWRADHGPDVDVWLAAYQQRFAGLADVLAERTAPDVPEPVAREVDDAFRRAAEACPDEDLQERLVDVQEAAQSALVAMVADRPEAAEHEQGRYLTARTAAIERLGVLELPADHGAR